MLLLNVCNVWSDIALSTPALWAKVSFRLPRGKGFGELVKIWFERTGTYRLHVSVTGPLDSGVAALIWDRSSQLQVLELCAEDGDDDDVVYRQLGGGIQPDSLPFLQALTIVGRDGLEFSPQEIVQLLDVSPNLTELECDNVQLVDAEDEAAEQLSLPNLHLLWLDIDTLLQYFSAPRLETLSLSINAATDVAANVIPFLQRSSPPLQKFVIRDLGDFVHLNDILTLVPTVTRLEIECLNFSSADSDHWFTSLAQIPPSVLPNLGTLHVHSMYPFSAPVWSAVLRALSARRTHGQIHTIRVSFLSFDRADIPVAAFRELSESGMHVWVGDHVQNVLLASQ